MKFFIEHKIIKRGIALLVITFLFTFYLLYCRTTYFLSFFEEEIKEMICVNNPQITLLDYDSLTGSFYDTFSLNNLNLEISNNKFNFDLIIEIVSWRDLIDFIIASMNKDYRSLKEIIKNNIYNFSNFFFIDSKSIYSSTISKIILSKNNLYIEDVEIKNRNLKLNIDSVDFLSSIYKYQDDTQIDLTMNFINIENQENNKISLDSMFLFSLDDNFYKVDAFGIDAPLLKEINLDNISISLERKKENETYNIDISSFNQTIYLDNIKYYFNSSLAIDSKNIKIRYLDIFNENKNIINIDGDINLTEKKLSLLLKTSNYQILGIEPEKSVIHISSKDLREYIFDFTLYNVSNLTKKKLDRINGSFFLECKDIICSEYNIDFYQNIVITDKDYRGEFKINDIEKITDFEIEVKSSFINILKKDRLDRVK